MLKICLAFGKSEPQYAYIRYAYKKHVEGGFYKVLVASIKVTTGKEFHTVQAAWNVKESKRGFHKLQATWNVKTARAGNRKRKATYIQRLKQMFRQCRTSSLAVGTSCWSLAIRAGLLYMMYY